MMFTITVRRRFSASHSVQVGSAPREAPHAHEWLVEVEIGADDVDRHGLVVDFHRVERALDECLADFDGALLDELVPFRESNPTAEHVARTIHERLDEKLARRAARLLRTTAWETENCGATYRP